MNYRINHMYCCASATPDGDPDITEAKWRMLPSHAQKIHEQCSHEPLTGEARHRLWISQGISAEFLFLFF